MITAENVKTYIESSLPCEHVQVEGDDGRHFEALMLSSSGRILCSSIRWCTSHWGIE